MKSNVVAMPVFEMNKCKLTGCKCDSVNCPEDVGGFTAYEVYNKSCRYRTLNIVEWQRKGLRK